MNQYYSLMESMEQACSKMQYDQAIEVSLKAIEEIPQLVRDTVREYGQWDIKSLPPLEFACNYLPVMCRHDDLQHIREIIQSLPKLAYWRDEVDLAIKRVKIMDKIKTLVFTNPGFIQANVGKELGVENRIISNMFYYAVKFGVIHREKEAKSYRLYSSKDLCPKCLESLSQPDY